MNKRTINQAYDSDEEPSTSNNPYLRYAHEKIQRVEKQTVAFPSDEQAQEIYNDFENDINRFIKNQELMRDFSEIQNLLESSSISNKPTNLLPRTKPPKKHVDKLNRLIPLILLNKRKDSNKSYT